MPDANPRGRLAIPAPRRPLVIAGLGVATLILIALLTLAYLRLIDSGGDGTTARTRDSITIVEPAFVDNGEQPWLVHLGFEPGQLGDNAFQVQITDWDGDPIPENSEPAVESRMLSLRPDMPEVTINLERTDPDDGMWADNSVAIPDDGWWNVRVTVDAEDEESTANFYLVLPDPNINGFESVALPESDPGAEALFQDGLDELTSIEALNWVERISSGDDVLVVSDRNLTASGRNGEDSPAAYDASVLYTAGFRARTDGSPPAPPRYDVSRTITIGPESWRLVNADEWAEQNPVRFGEPATWGSIYPNPDHFQLGGTQRIAGEESQIVTFYTPNDSGQSEAFFTWWVGIESGLVHQVAMIAPSHYMIWEYDVLGDDFTIDPPDPDTVVESADLIATPATPDAPTMPQPGD